ncbi:outer membrane beta-barrel family protein [Flavobacterium paronense]|nr:outer membrane beta-barrel family protein [Flavobacterium paronense]MDN3677560.1 outer membrane beta-barrel family protein [Flavobacterium paronense]
MNKFSLLLILFVTQFVLAQEKEKRKEQEKEKPEELKEVVVENETKTFAYKNGNIKVDVANSIFNSSPNTLDLLAKLPKIQITPEKDGISVIGKGTPLLYIDNQSVDMEEFNALAVEDIKTIEIINNPSSKYEANGRVVILITRKFSKKEGFKVVLSENASFKKYFNNYSGINASFKTGKLEFKTNFNYNQITVWESNGNDLTMPDYDIHSNYLVTAITKRPQFLYGSGLFYKINEDDYLTLNGSRKSQDDIFDINTNTFNQEQSTINYINTLNRNDENREFTNCFLNYNHKIKSLEANLFSGFQYSNFNQQMASVVFNDYNDTGSELTQHRNQKFDVNVFSGRTDLEKKFKNEMQLELGALYLSANADTHFTIENINPVSTTKSDYNYKEQNIAAYSQLSGSYKKLNYTVGLRAENTIVKGKYAAENTFSVDKDYINLFPKAEIGMTIDSSNTISVNYAKSIVRPNYSSTSQASAYINPYFVWANNINLNPTITDEISLDYGYKDKSLRLVFYKTKNPIYYGASYNDSQDLLTFMTTNFEKESGISIELTIPFKYKFWTTTNVVNLGYTKIVDSTALMMETKPSVYIYSNHIFSLPKEIEVSLTGWGYTKQKLGIFERSGLVTFDAAVTKKFFTAFDCALSWSDIFRKMNYRGNFTINNIAAKGIYYTDSSAISLSIKYSFGKIKKSEFKERSVDENSGRIN